VERLFAPRSVAIIGASADPRKWGYMAAEQALRDRDWRAVYLVNSRGGQILGSFCQRSVHELPQAPDLAIVTVPPAAFETTVDDLLTLGTRSIVAITAGFGETSAAGAELERRLVARVRAAGAALVGPNCMGVFDGHAPFRCMPWAEIEAGPVGFISQSGGLIMDLSLRLQQARLGVSRAISIGNQADLGLTELVRNLAADDATRVIAVYGESFPDGRATFEAIADTVAAGKPVVLLSPDCTAGAERAARSHTASLVTDRRLIAAAARDAGACYAASLREMAEMLQALASRQRGRRGARRTAIVTDTGGPGVLLAGAAERAGLDLPRLPAAVQAAITALLTPRAVVGNPVDLVDNLDVEPAVGVLRTLLACDGIDAVLMNLHAFVHDTPQLEHDMGRQLAAVAEAAGKPVMVSCRSLDIPGVAGLVEGGVPVFRDGEAAAQMLALVTDLPYPRWSGRAPASPAPISAAALGCDYADAREHCRVMGIDVAEGELAPDLDAALRIAAGLGYPVVLKAADLPRKSDAGGVLLDICNEAALEAAWRTLGERAPGSRRIVERMVRWSDAVELLVGVRADERFGPVLLLGLGGVHAEAAADAVLLLAPADAARIETALRGLRAAPRLFGARGTAPVDIAKVATVAASLVQFVLAHSVVEVMEINPLLVGAQGAIALDARIVITPRVPGDSI
jgi:acetate---CoA ligase (ADP-forming)